MNSLLKFISPRFIFVLVCVPGLWSAETGKVTGIIMDTKTGEPLIGANIMIRGTVIGSSSDVNGEFELYPVPAGEQIITASYIAYASREILITVVPGGTVVTQISLEEKSLEMEAVSVMANLRSNRDGGVLAKQKKSFRIEDGISSAQMSRSGDSNAADALRRITGASVKEGKYVAVRGLGGRYTNAQVNGGPIASPEPDKKSIPLTLFPTALLESISVIKTFTPDLPGVFAGGFVNIKTKAYPDNYVLKFKLAVKDNSNIHSGNIFRRSDSGALDYFGYDDGTRAVPKDIPEDRMLNMWLPPAGTNYANWRQELSQFGRDFQTSFCVKNIQTAKPISVGVNLGNRFNPTYNLEYGYFVNGSFSNSYNILGTELSTFSLYDNTYIPTHRIENSKSSYKTNLALGFSSGIKWRNSHKLKFYYLYTHSSSDNVIYGTGMTPNIDQGVFIKQKFSEKSIRNLTLSGDHQLKNDRSLEWKINLGDSHLNEPDEKSHNYLQGTGNDVYTLVTSSSKAGMRSFTSGRDMNGNMDVDYSGRIAIGSLENIKLKTGFRIQGRSRNFRRRTFYHWFYGTDNQDAYIVRDQTFGSAFDNDNFLSSDSDGWILVENTDESSRSAYRADETILAQYIMVSVPYEPAINWFEEIRFITGVRREIYTMGLIPYNGVTGEIYENPFLGEGETRGEINEVNYLPSYNVIMSFVGDFKLRFSYSQTVARPQFRELAPLEYQEFYGGDVVVGYQNLKKTGIANYDFRFEWYPRTNELVAVSVFAKTFSNPIEAARFETADLTYKTYQNTSKAETHGIELEIRKHLPVLQSLGRMMIVFNSTWSESRVDQNKEITLFNGETITNSARSGDRPLQGQSNFLANTEVNFRTDNNLRIAAAFNIFSRRLVALGSGNVTDVYEYPFPSLNLTVGKTLKNYLVTIKVKNILNSSIRFGQSEPGGNLKLTRSYRPGQSISIGVGYDF
ncbi:MAG: carboxypeptidase-like regulatory domain-containing protein [Fidelibacterota bacterium]